MRYAIGDQLLCAAPTKNKTSHFPSLLGSTSTIQQLPRVLASVEWPARFQPWDEHTIIDGAHNPAAAHILAETWREMFGHQRATLILGVLADKNLSGICGSSRTD